MDIFVKSVDVYLRSGPYDHLMMITPGTESDASHFHNPEGPIQFKVRFVKGKANVPSHIADYLIDKEAIDLEPPVAPSIIRPQTIIAEERMRTHRMLGA